MIFPLGTRDLGAGAIRLIALCTSTKTSDSSMISLQPWSVSQSQLVQTGKIDVLSDQLFNHIFKGNHSEGTTIFTRILRYEYHM